MAKSFDLTARLKVVGPYGTKNVVSALKRDLKTVKGSIDLKLSPVAARNANVLNKALDTLQKNISRVSSNAMNATYSINQLGNAFSQFGQNAKANNIALNNTVKNLNKIKSTTSSATSEIENFGKSAGLAVKRFVAFTLATGAIFGLVTAFVKASKEAIEFQDELVKISQVTGKTLQGVRNLGDEVSNLSVKYGVSSKELLNAAKTLVQAGFSARETKKALDSLAKSTLAPSFDDLGNTTEGLISIFGQFRSELNGTKLAVEDFDSILGSINQVSKDFAVEADDIVTAIRGAGSVFAQASEGLDKPRESLNKLIALFTSVRATTRESAESISTGLRTIFARIQRRSTIDFLKQFGIQLEDLEGKFVGPFEAVKRLNEGLKDLDPKDIRYSQIAEELGGIRQLSKLLPLIRQFPVALEAYDSAQRGTNSTTEDAIKAQESLVVQFKKTKEEFLRLIKDVLHTDSFTTLTKTALDFAGALIKIASSVKSIAPYLALALGIGGVRSGAQFLTGFKQAFSSGGNKTLAAGAGSAAGTVLGGNPLKNSQSLDANTAALKALTIAILGRATGVQYPKGLTFSKGGIVPGVGNQDTVPAMLTPGEMVIPRKYVAGSSGGVKGLTEDELARIKAVKAGKIPTQSKKRGNDILAGATSISSPAVAGLFLQPEGNDLRTVRFGKVSSLSESNRQGAAAAGATLDNSAYYPFHAAFIEPSQSGKMKKDMDTLIKSNVRQLTTKYGGGNIINIADRDKIIQTSNLAGAGGSLFEAFVQSLGSEFNKSDSGAAWDITKGAFGSGLKNLFGPIPASIKHLDVKLTANESAYSDLKNKTNNQIALGEPGFGFTPYGGQQGSSYDEISKRNLSTSFGNKTIKKFASGGMAMGTDTVPAMLTPGEYVINRDSAQKFGMHNLDKINRYATGGEVTSSGPPNLPRYVDQIITSSKASSKEAGYIRRLATALNGLSLTADEFQKAMRAHLGAVSRGKDSQEALTKIQDSFTRKQAAQANRLGLNTTTISGNAGRRTERSFISKIGLIAKDKYRTFTGTQSLTDEEKDIRRANLEAKEVKRARFTQNAYFAGAGLGTAGALITANSSSRQGAGLGGALTGAGAGIATGAQLGPVGAIAGGLVGGLLGFRDGIDEFNKSKALQNTEASLSKLDEAVSRLSENLNPKNIIDFRQALLGFESSKAYENQVESDSKTFAVSNAIASGIGFGGDEKSRREREAAGGFIPYLFSNSQKIKEGSVSGVKTNINDIFSDLDTQAKQVEEAIRLAAEKGDFVSAQQIATDNTGILNTRDSRFRQSVLDSADTLTGETKAGIASIIQSRAQTFRGRGVGGSAKSDSDIALAKEAARIKDALSKAVTELDLVIIGLNKFNAQLDRSGNIFDKFSQANDTLLSQSQGNFAVSKSIRENPFNDINSYSASEIKLASRQLGSESLATGVNAAKLLKDELPAFLQTLSIAGEENAQIAFGNKLDTTYSAYGTKLPEEVKNLLKSSFNSQITNDQANFKDIAKPEFIEKLLKDGGLELYLDSSKKLNDKRLELEHKYIDELSKIVQLREVVEQKQTNLDRTKNEILRRNADRDGRDLTFEEATRGSRSKYTRLTATTDPIGRVVNRNPTAATLGKEIRDAQAAQQLLTNKGNAIGGSLTSAELAEQVRLGEIIKNNSEALNILNESTEALAFIENERSKLEKKKEVGRGLADKLLGGGVRGRLEFARQANLVRNFQEAKDKKAFVFGLTGDKFNDLKTGIEQLVQVFKNTPGRGNEAKILQEQFDAAGGDLLFNPGDEAKLRALEDEVAATQLAAATALKTVAENGLPTMVANANNAFLQLQDFLTRTVARLEASGKFAGGGFVSGPGGPRGDKIPAMLSDGEFVINAAAASRLGPDQLHALNSVHAARGGGARALARQQGISLKEARTELRHRYATEQYNKTMNYIQRKNIPYAELQLLRHQSVNLGFNETDSELLNYANKYQIGRISGLANVQRHARIAKDFQRRGGNFKGNLGLPRKNGGPIGTIKGYANGGSVSGESANIASAMGQFQSSVLILSQAVNQLAQINIPSNITMTGNHTVEVVLNGASVLSELLNGPLSGLIRSEIQSAIQRHIPLQSRMEGTY